MFTKEILAQTPIALALSVPQVQSLLTEKAISALQEHSAGTLADIPNETWLAILAEMIQTGANNAQPQQDALVVRCRNCGFINVYESQ